MALDTVYNLGGCTIHRALASVHERVHRYLDRPSRFWVAFSLYTIGLQRLFYVLTYCYLLVLHGQTMVPMGMTLCVLNLQGQKYLGIAGHIIYYVYTVRAQHVFPRIHCKHSGTLTYHQKCPAHSP